MHECPKGYQEISKPPPLGAKVLVYGYAESELYAKDEEPEYYIVEHVRNGYYVLLGAVYYSVWVHVIGWRKIP